MDDFFLSSEANLAEWSKAVDLSSTIERCVSSNLTVGNKPLFCVRGVVILSHFLQEMAENSWKVSAVVDPNAI